MKPPDRPNGSPDGPDPASDEEAPAMDLRAIFDMLSRTPDARQGLVSEIREQLANGTYMTEDKLNTAIYRLLQDILTEQ